MMVSERKRACMVGEGSLSAFASVGALDALPIHRLARDSLSQMRDPPNLLFRFELSLVGD